MIEILIAIILAPLALIAGLLVLAFVVGTIKAIFNAIFRRNRK